MPVKKSFEFDVVVMGAGPAGSSAALSARKLGLSVAIVDKAVFPRDKLCGGLVSGRSRTALCNIFGYETTGPDFLVSRAVSFNWKGEVLAGFEAPHDLCFTMRYDFDAELLKRAAAAGCEVFAGERSSELLTDENTVVLGEKRLNYRALIGADGVNSAVARHVFGQAFTHDKIGFALECEVPLDALPDGTPTQIDFRAVNWGYGWVFPKSGSWTIGVGGMNNRNPRMKDHMIRFLALNGVEPGGVRIKGHFIPGGDYRRVPGRGNILLAGDAAGLVDSLTGEGIAYALESGQLAADAIAAALAAGRPQTAVRVYSKMLKPIHAELNKVNRLRKYVFSSDSADRFQERLRTSENLRMAFFELLEGRLSYGDLEKQYAKRAFKNVARNLVAAVKGH